MSNQKYSPPIEDAKLDFCSPVFWVFSGDRLFIHGEKESLDLIARVERALSRKKIVRHHVPMEREPRPWKIIIFILPPALSGVRK